MTDSSENVPESNNTVPSQLRRWGISAFLGSAVLVAAAFLPRHNGIIAGLDALAVRADSSRGPEPEIQYTPLATFASVVDAVGNDYVDPERAIPRKMLIAALTAMQRAAAPVMIDHEEGQPTARVRVHNQSQEIRVDNVTGLHHLKERFTQAFTFVRTHLLDQDIKISDVEYAAINGMLRTLDPHTVLLPPKLNEDVRTQTRGEFGGLGIVVSIRDQQLTVIRPMPGTPADRVGVRRRDRVVKIDDESTLNMPLDDAVARLRGVPGSRVTVWVTREQSNGSYSAPQRFDLTREVIHVPSVESRIIENANVGYLRITSFQGNTSRDMDRALAAFDRSQVRGLILDLRDDPGGLLDQAVSVADAFLKRGTIVTTAGRSPDDRESEVAEDDGKEPTYPLVVLINSGSASASEIVAGALKSHDRALIIGERSFGKGSVQTLHDNPDGSALKLTFAQYLTPGDVSIQGVGIVPDIAIEPMTVDREDMDLEPNRDYLRESDLRAHLTSAQARAAETPSEVLRYFLPPRVRQRLREAAPEDLEPNEREDEFLTRFAKEILARATSPNRRAMIRDARPAVASAQAVELGRATQELRRLGVDWTPPAVAAADRATLDVVVSTNRASNVATAGDDFELHVRVTNRSARPVFQLRAATKSDFRLFSQREVVFGRLAPGETREWSSTLGVCKAEGQSRTCRVPRDFVDRTDAIKVEFHEGASPDVIATAQIETTVHALPRPHFQISTQFSDAPSARNMDGQLQAGEQGIVYLQIKNVGAGPTVDAQANLRNESGRGILLRDGRFRVPVLAPGAEHRVAFTFAALPDFAGPAKFEVSVSDLEIGESASQKFSVPLGTTSSPAGPATAGAPQSVTLKVGAALSSSPTSAAQADVVGTVRQAVAARIIRTLGTAHAVELDGRVVWVQQNAIETAVAASPPAQRRPNRPTTSAPAPAVEWKVAETAPIITISQGPPLTTRDATASIVGEIDDPRGLRDMYVFVGGRKVHFSPVGSPHHTFSLSVPLRPGLNYVAVFARHDDDSVSREVRVVRRDGRNGEILETPDEWEEDESDAFLEE